MEGELPKMTIIVTKQCKKREDHFRTLLSFGTKKHRIVIIPTFM